MTAPGKQRRIGLTLVELMVVMAVAGTLVLAQAPAVQRIRDAAAKTRTVNNLKQTGLALHNCHDAYNHFPPAWGQFPAPPAGGGSARRFHRSSFQRA